MKLSMYSLQKILFQGEISLLHCNTASGEITILDKHETLLTVLSAGTIKVVDNHKKELFFQVSSGFLEVRPDNEVRCLID